MRILSSFLFVLMAAGLLGQQDLKPEEWSFDINQVGEKEYELIYMANLEKPWVIYSVDTPEGGPIGTQVTYTSNNVKPNGKIKESGDRKEGMDPMFDMEVIKYTSAKNYVLKQSVTLEDNSKPITGYVSYMLCNNEMCLPPRDAEFSFTVKTINAPTRKNATKQNVKPF